MSGSLEADGLFGVVRGGLVSDLVLRFGQEVFAFDVEVGEGPV